MDCCRRKNGLASSALLLLVGLGLAKGYDVLSRDQDLMLASGDKVVLECYLSGEGFSPMDTPIQFLKGDNKHGINVNKMILSPFQETNRYTVEYKGNSYNEATLTIDGATAAENDKFFCKVGDQIAVSYTVTIPESIKEVTLTSTTGDLDPVTGGKVFKFEADKPSFVNCHVKGGRPEPVVSIFRDGTEDITASFQVNKAPVEEMSEGEGLEVNRYQVFLKNDNFVLSTDFNGQNISCKANVPVNKSRARDLEITGLKKTDSALMEITYAPKIECESEKETMEGTKQFRIECTVKANPKIDMEAIVWSFGGENDTTEIKHVKNQEFENGQYETMAEENDSEVILIFEIKNVNSSDFKVYTLQVENAVGQKTHKIDVFRKTTTVSTTTQMPRNEGGNLGAVEGDEDSGAKNIVATILSLVISITLAILL